MLFEIDREMLHNGQLNELVCCALCPRCFCLSCLEITEVKMITNNCFGVNCKLKSPFGSIALFFLQAPECSEWPCPMCRQTNNIVDCSSYESVDLMKQVIRLLLKSVKVVVWALNV